MSREDSVYLAKLAEQAERYEGQHLTRSTPHSSASHTTRPLRRRLSR
jgi:hypothetical protein